MSIKVEAVPTYFMTSMVTTEVEIGSKKVVDRQVEVLGVSGATAGCLGHAKGNFKLLATIASVVQIFSDSVLVSTIGSGLNSVGSWCGAVPDMIVEGFKACKGLFGGKATHAKTWASVFKCTGDAAALPGLFEKMQVVKLAVSHAYVFTVINKVFAVIADLFTLFVEFVRKSSSAELQAADWDKKLVSAEIAELYSARIKAVVAIAFHTFLAVGAIFLIPLSPIAVTVLGVVYTVAVIANHYISSNKKDCTAPVHKKYLGQPVEARTVAA